MILIGQYDSSFVRRIGIALTLYRIPFEHRPWSVFGDATKIAELNPLTRVPTMVLDDGEVLVDSLTILDHIDSLVEPKHRLLPVAGPARREAMRTVALATGLADKGVALFYEIHLHEVPSPVWVERCKRQIFGTLSTLEADRAEHKTKYWYGDKIGHADIAVACSIRHVASSHPDLFKLSDFPALAAHCDTLEQLDVFQTIFQPFIPPA